MENFRWTSDGTTPTLTPKFILSADQAPRLSDVQTPTSVPLPIIDMGPATSASTIAESIARASEEYGFFMITNHGVPEEAWLRASKSIKDFFLLPPEEKTRLSGGGGGGSGPKDDVKVFKYYLNDWEDGREVSMWSEVVNHVWHPTRDFAGALPEMPPTYRDHLVAYAKEMGLLMTRLLSLLSKGLGLEEDYLQRRLGQQPFYKCHGNYYPPCPHPYLTIGLPIHTDSLALGVVRTLDDVPGLQLLNDGQWVAVDRLPNSFIVNIGDQLEVLSNGRYKSVLHRVVNNETWARVSLAFFWGPDLNESIGPIEDLVDEQHPPVYKSYAYKEFIEEHDNQKGKRRQVKQLFRLQPSAH